MTDQELFDATITLFRSARVPLLIDLLTEVQRRLGRNLLPPVPPKAKSSRAAYMRAWRIKDRAKRHTPNPFDNA